MRPTWGGAVVLIFAIYAIAITPYSTQAIHLVTSLFLALLILNVPFALLAVRRVSIRRSVPARVREGEEFDVRLTVTNVSPLTKLHLCLQDDHLLQARQPELLVPVLPGSGEETLVYRTHMEKRGLYRAQHCRLSSSAPFGLFRVTRKLDVVSEWIAHPRTYDIKGDLAESRTGITSPAAPLTARPGQGMGFYGLREYRSGDPARKIHWPSTKRLRRVVVKEFEDEVSQSALIVLDTDRTGLSGKGSQSNFESAVRVAASLSHSAMKSRQAVTLAWHDASGGRVRCDRFSGDELPALDTLAGMDVSDVPVSRVLESLHIHMPRRVQVVVSAMRVTDDTLSAIHRLREGGWPVSIIVVPGVTNDSDESLTRVRERLREAGIPGVVLDPALDLAATLPHLTLRPGPFVRPAQSIGRDA